MALQWASAARKSTASTESQPSLVDGRVQRVSRVRLLPGAEAALLDALACARVRIDELERTGWRYSKVLRRAYGSAGCCLLTLDTFSDVTCDCHSA